MRMIAILSESQKFCNYKKEDILEIIINSKERLLHNRNTLIECNSIINGHKRLAELINE